MLSWYQIAGIHGRPYQAFDGVQPTPGNQENGYCTHVSILFPTWHRPYLALYEQVLYGMIQQIAQLWPAGAIRDKYVTAAANFRIPYWDWAAVPPDGQSVLPDSVGGSPAVNVSGPNGQQVIANPLYAYQFKPLDPNALPDQPFNVFPTTMRYPSTQDASAVSQNNLVAQQLDNSAASFRSRLFNLFTNYHDYTTFSNEAWIPQTNPNGYDSIESVHDQIHGLTGSGGHMSYIEYSAFDPIFFLHHAMVDRCFAMWQALYPDSYVVPEPATYSTYTNSAGQTQDSSSRLTPFHEDGNGDFWTSDSVRSTATFGYAYPETANSTGANITAQVVSAINSLYGATPSKGKRDASVGSSTSKRDLGSQYREWIANIRVEKNALSEPFFIHIFIGPFNITGPSSWSFEPNLVGSHFVFTKAVSSACPSCDPNQLVTATIPITSALENNFAEGKLASLQPADVEPFLISNLKYRITRLNGQEVGNGDVPSLEISIVSANITMPVDDSELPKWGTMVGHMDVSTE